MSKMSSSQIKVQISSTSSKILNFKMFDIESLENGRLESMVKITGGHFHWHHWCPVATAILQWHWLYNLVELITGCLLSSYPCKNIITLEKPAEMVPRSPALHHGGGYGRVCMNNGYVKKIPTISNNNLWTYCIRRVQTWTNMVKFLNAAQFSFLSLFAWYLTLNKIMGYHVLKTADKDEGLNPVKRPKV